jgi:hypothetical protein
MMSDDDIRQEARRAFPELEGVPDSQIEISEKPPIEPAGTDVWQLKGKLEGRFWLFIRRHPKISATVFFVCLAKGCQDWWGFAKNSYEMIRPVVAQVPVVVEEVQAWLQSPNSVSSPTGARPGKILVVSPDWKKYGTDAQIADALNHVFFEPPQPAFTTTTTTTTTTTPEPSPSVEYKKEELWFVPEGSGIPRPVFTASANVQLPGLQMKATVHSVGIRIGPPPTA